MEIVPAAGAEPVGVLLIVWKVAPPRGVSSAPVASESLSFTHDLFIGKPAAVGEPFHGSVDRRFVIRMPVNDAPQ